MSIDKAKLEEELTKVFINYQQRLDFPMPEVNETFTANALKYRSDPMFRSKVRCLVGGVMQVVASVEDGE